MMVKQNNYHARKSRAHKNPIVAYLKCMKHVKHGQMATKQMHENQSKFAHAA